MSRGTSSGWISALKSLGSLAYLLHRYGEPALQWWRGRSPGRRGARGGGYRGGGGGSAAAGASWRHLNHPTPPGAPAEVARILGSGNYYEVLALPAGADEAAVRGAKRKLSLATHPDKIGSAPGAADAFRLVTEVITKRRLITHQAGWPDGGKKGGGGGGGGF